MRSRVERAKQIGIGQREGGEGRPAGRRALEWPYGCYARAPVCSATHGRIHGRAVPTPCPHPACRPCRLYKGGGGVLWHMVELYLHPACRSCRLRYCDIWYSCPLRPPSPAPLRPPHPVSHCQCPSHHLCATPWPGCRRTWRGRCHSCWSRVAGQESRARCPSPPAARGGMRRAGCDAM